MRNTETSIQYIPVTQPLAEQLSLVANAATRRVVKWLIALVIPAWFAGFQVLVGRGYEAGVAAPFATVIVALMLGTAVVAAALWAKRIRSSRFVIRERGHFYVGGAFRARVSGDRTRRSIRASLGDVMLDEDEDAHALQTLWDLLAAGKDQPFLEIDYTPNRHLLAVRHASGGGIFSRSGYIPPPSVEARSLAKTHEFHRLRASWPFVAALSLLLAAYASLVGFTGAPDASLTATLFLMSFFVTLVMAIGLATLGAYRLVVAIGEGAVRRARVRSR